MNKEKQYVEKRLARAIAALDEIADRLGDEWDEYEWDSASSARQALVEKLHDLQSDAVAWRGAA